MGCCLLDAPSLYVNQCWPSFIFSTTPLIDNLKGSQIKTFLSKKKYIWKCCLQNVGHIVQRFLIHTLEPVLFSIFSIIKRLSASPHHYNDVIMSAMASQITSLTVVYSTIYSGTDEINHQSSASMAFVGNSPVTGDFPAHMTSNAKKCFHWMTSSWAYC